MLSALIFIIISIELKGRIILISGQCDPPDSKPNSNVLTFDNNKPCFFPFKVSADQSTSDQHTDCIAEAGTGKLWCPTTCNYPRDKKKAYCKWDLKALGKISCATLVNSRAVSLPPTEQNSPKCVFPFYYNGECYTDCIKEDGSNPHVPLYWCATIDSLLLSTGSENRANCLYSLELMNSSPICKKLPQSWPAQEPKTVNNAICHFPFIAFGQCFDDCADLFGETWCSTITTFDLTEQHFGLCRYFGNFKKHESTIAHGYYRISVHKCLAGFSSVLCQGGARVVFSTSVLSEYNSASVLVQPAASLVPVGTEPDVIWEVLPQPKSLHLIRSAQLCPQPGIYYKSMSLEDSHRNVQLDDMRSRDAQLRMLVTPVAGHTDVFTLRTVDTTYHSGQNVGFEVFSGDPSRANLQMKSGVTTVEWKFTKVASNDPTLAKIACAMTTVPPRPTTTTTTTTKKPTTTTTTTTTKKPTTTTTTTTTKKPTITTTTKKPAITTTTTAKITTTIKQLITSAVIMPTSSKTSMTIIPTINSRQTSNSISIKTTDSQLKSTGIDGNTPKSIKNIPRIISWRSRFSSTLSKTIVSSTIIFIVSTILGFSYGIKKLLLELSTSASPVSSVSPGY